MPFVTENKYLTHKKTTFWNDNHFKKYWKLKEHDVFLCCNYSIFFFLKIWRTILFLFDMGKEKKNTKTEKKMWYQLAYQQWKNTTGHSVMNQKSLGFLIYFLSTCISHFYKVLFNALCKAISVIKYSFVRMHISFL